MRRGEEKKRGWESRGRKERKSEEKEGNFMGEERGRRKKRKRKEKTESTEKEKKEREEEGMEKMERANK